MNYKKIIIILIVSVSASIVFADTKRYILVATSKDMLLFRNALYTMSNTNIKTKNDVARVRQGIHGRMRVRFEPFSDNLVNNSSELLDGIGKELNQFEKDNNGEIEIELVGHTDSIGTPESNLKLSKRRAQSVKNYLIRHFGFSNRQITSIGMGEAERLYDNRYESGRENNRRVDISIFRHEFMEIDMNEDDRSFFEKISDFFGFGS